MWDVDKAVKYLVAHGGDQSLGRCAEFVRKAIEAGGVQLARHGSAKDYGSSLLRAGFLDMGRAPLGVRAGDVGIVQPIPGHPHGHMAMFSGHIWISDFKQWRGLYPGKSYREQKPAYAIYRYRVHSVPASINVRRSYYA